MTRHDSSNPPATASARGFTLIEVLIVVVIIGVLAGIAFPSYQNFIKSGHRSAAQNHLLQMATKQSQYLADTRTYADDANINSLVPAPAELAARYTFESKDVANLAPLPSFIISATPKGHQAPDVVLSIDHTGEKKPSDKW